MREMIQMVVILTILSCVSGGLLASIRNGTQEKIEYQQLKFVKGPAIRSILEGSSNDPITDRFKITDGDSERSFYVGVFEGKASAVAFETSGKGYGGDIGVMIGVDLDNDKIIGVGVTTHSETPGLGSRAKTDPSFTAQFKEQPLEGTFQVTTDGGKVDALSGATLTSRGVSNALTDAAKLYATLKPKISEELKKFPK